MPALQRYDSLYRFLLKGTAPNPDDRFQSAEEMADQLFGVLREVVADREGTPRRDQQAVHGTDARRIGSGPTGASLPRPQVSSDDPSAGYLATITAADSGQLIAQLARGARAHRGGRPPARRGDDRRGAGEAEAQLAEIEATRPVGVAKSPGIAGSPRWRGRTPIRPGPASNACTTPCRGSSHRSWRWALPASSGECPAATCSRRGGGTRSSRGPIRRSRAHHSGSPDAASRPATARGLWRHTSSCPTPQAATSTRRRPDPLP